jgi:hypothetical protein
VERKNAMIKKNQIEAVDEELIAFCKMTPSFRSLGG